MKTILLIILINTALLGNAQGNPTQQDSIKCLPVKHVLFGGTLAFAIFYKVAHQGFAPLRLVAFKKKSLYQNKYE